MDSTLVSDSTYDKIKRRVSSNGKKVFIYREKNSVQNEIGAPLTKKFKKIKHSKKMLSLSNTFDAKGMEDFISKISKLFKYKRKKFDFSSELKIDGISASLTYERGTLVRGLSRGDGIIGEDILENLKTIKKYRKKIKRQRCTRNFRDKGEVYISKKDFKSLEKKFTNPEMLQVDL